MNEVRPIDANALLAYWAGDDYRAEEYVGTIRKVINQAPTIDGWNRGTEPREQYKSLALTLEEMRGMRSEPVWIVEESFACWEILKSCGHGHDPDLCHFIEILPLKISNYGKTWIAYRSRPKEEV